MLGVALPTLSFLWVRSLDFATLNLHVYAHTLYGGLLDFYSKLMKLMRQ